ncbi:hypothetical protein ACFQS3_10630 [Glycomyces mayteni]|uniref:Uncharacterized protein n=1 Tax=Glycomyces mayteni TaxID=543887 RepID=A0ABW2D7V3_9ACTN|nr:hypothetical protein GCM10025732_31420 [Glycomyces mayteni]
MSNRLRTGLTAAGALAFVLIAAAPAAASTGHQKSAAEPDGFTPPYASVRITDADNRDFSVRITSDDDSVRITKLPGLNNRDFSIAPANRDF